MAWHYNHPDMLGWNPTNVWTQRRGQVGHQCCVWCVSPVGLFQFGAEAEQVKPFQSLSGGSGGCSVWGNTCRSHVQVVWPGAAAGFTKGGSGRSCIAKVHVQCSSPPCSAHHAQLGLCTLKFHWGVHYRPSMSYGKEVIARQIQVTELFSAQEAVGKYQMAQISKGTPVIKFMSVAMWCLVWFVGRTRVDSIFLDGSEGTALSRRGRGLQSKHGELRDEHKPNVTWEFWIYLSVLIDVVVLIVEGLDLTFSLRAQVWE